MTKSYEIVEGQSPDGTAVWSVVEYVDGICTGGDHHWLRPEFAENALSFYSRGGRHPKAPIASVEPTRFRSQIHNHR